MRCTSLSSFGFLRIVENFDGEVTYESHGYVLMNTGNVAPKLHEDLSLLLPTSGSTGSPKLVRHCYNNIEANARNVAQMFKMTGEEKTNGFTANALHNGAFLS